MIIITVVIAGSHITKYICHCDNSITVRLCYNNQTKTHYYSIMHIFKKIDGNKYFIAVK